MATTQNTFTGDGSTTNFSFTFEYIKQADVKAKIDGVNTTAFTLANATTVSFTSAPSNGAAIIIFRDTDNDEKTATFFAGSAIKAEDLNSNFDQVLFTAQEVDNNALQTLGGTMSGNLNMGANTNVVFEGTTDNANETTLTVVDPTADRTITLPDVTGTVVTTGDTGTVATGMIADSAITSAKISDGTIATGDIADDAVTTAKIADANVTTALIADASVTTAKLASNAVTTAKITDANVTTAKIADDAITAAKIAANAVGSSEIAANAVTSSELADASVDTAAIVDANVTTVKVADAAITTAKINDSAITSAKIGANQVVEGKIADNAVTTSKIPDSGITTPKIADNAVTNVKLADAELRELATMGSNTASALADLTQAEVQILDGATVSTDELNILDGVTANATEINQLDGNTLTNSFTASSTTQFPSSSAISGYVLGLMDNLGGFVAIANENSFPTTNPDPSDDAGTVVSISDAGGLVVSASGTASGQTTGGTAVTITGFPSALQSSTLPAGQGLQVVSTSTLNTYTYHKVLGTDADIAQLNDDVNDFFARYRVGSTNPTTDLDAGDLFFNTSTGKMLVYDATNTEWEEVQAVGNYFINTLSSSGGTGGGSATFNGSAYRFTLSNPGSVAQQHIVSINGVIQKPNSGTSQPSEGFAIDNADIILAAAPATGSEFFIVTVGTSVNIGTPSNDTITNAMVKADAAIAGTKISPDFGSQNVVTTGSVGIGTTSPSNKLDLSGTNGTNYLALTNTSASDGANFRYSQILFRGTQSGGEVSALASVYAGHDGSSDDTKGWLSFRTNDGDDGESPTERIRILSDGKVGIGTSSPAQPLHVVGTIRATTDFQLRDSSDNRVLVIEDASNDARISNEVNGGDIIFRTNSGSNSERMRIDSSGRLLVGISGDQSISNDVNALVQIFTTSAGKLLIGRNDSTVSSGNHLGIIDFHTLDGGSQRGARIAAIASGDHAAGDVPTDITFSTCADGSDALTERARIDSSGNTLIGTTTASSFNGVGRGHSLVVAGTTSETDITDNHGAAITISNKDGTANNTAGLHFAREDTDGTPHYCGASVVAQFKETQVTGQYPKADLAFLTSTAANNAPSEKMRINSSGKLLVGTSSDYAENVQAAFYGASNGGIALASGTSGLSRLMFADATAGNAGAYVGSIIYSHADNTLRFNVNGGTERMRIDGGGRVLVGTSTEITTSSGHLIQSADNTGAEIVLGRSATSVAADVTLGCLHAFSNGGSTYESSGEIRILSDGAHAAGNKPGRIVFSTTASSASSPTERMRIDNLGNVTMTTASGGQEALTINRSAADGTLISFQQAGTAEGNIAVSGSTVSYNGAHLTRWSQLPGNAERITILRGTVLSNIDEMCEWGDEDNEQLNRTKVSEVEGDPNVAGVFQSWDDSDEVYTNDFYCAMTGDFIIRIAQGTTVARGDLLMSAGDGTAKPQDDDIVRSKTIAKVTSTNVTCTYDDGSYCVPCVLMAC